MTARPRCPRGHWLSTTAPADHLDTCRCVPSPRTRRRRRRRSYPLSADLRNQGLGRRARGRPIRTVTLTGHYL